MRPGSRWVHPGSLGSLGSALGFFGFMRDGWVNARSLGTIGCTLRVVGFIRGRWIQSGAPWGSLG